MNLKIKAYINHALLTVYDVYSVMFVSILDFHIDDIMETVCNLLVMVANETITILFTSCFLKSWYKTLAFSLS